MTTNDTDIAFYIVSIEGIIFDTDGEEISDLPTSESVRIERDSEIHGGLDETNLYNELIDTAIERISDKYRWRILEVGESTYKSYKVEKSPKDFTLVVERWDTWELQSYHVLGTSNDWTRENLLKALLDSSFMTEEAESIVNKLTEDQFYLLNTFYQVVPISEGTQLVSHPRRQY